MTQKILWLDNDLSYIGIYADEMRDNDFEVTVVKSAAEAEVELIKNAYNLLILDVMIPTFNEKEEVDYPPADTEYGTKTGLYFFKRMKPKLEEKNTAILVTTVRLDQKIREEFVEAGLPVDHFATKFALRDAPEFVKKVRSILRSG